MRLRAVARGGLFRSRSRRSAAPAKHENHAEVISARAGIYLALQGKPGPRFRGGDRGRIFKAASDFHLLVEVPVPETSFSVLILAAGKATRFKSAHTKVLHMLAGRPLGEYVLETAFACRPERAYMVVGHEAARVRQALGREGLTFIVQPEQRGTGDAVMVSRAELERCPSPALVVLVGDAPLLSAHTLGRLVNFHARERASATILTTRLADPSGYGRILRTAGNRVRAIVEEKDLTPAQKKIREINSGIICFDRARLLAHLDEITNNNSQQEFLLTDMARIFNRQRLKVLALPVPDSREVLGVNDRRELARVEKNIRLRKAEALMRNGVTLSDPETTVIDDPVEVGADSRIEAGVHLLGRTRLGHDCIVHPYSQITDSTLGDRVTVLPFCVIATSEVAADATLGPFAHLRDGASIGVEARIGNFVEVKKSRIGRGTKSLHLTYLGDATIGENVNVGAGAVTCNYDGEKKNPTVIEDRVFVGSGSMLVAPITIGKNSYVAAGSTLTEDVPPRTLAIGRARQVNKEGWISGRSEKKSPKSSA